MFNFFAKTEEKRPRIYLDHAASTPLRPEVLSAMMPFLTGQYGNPSAIHHEGRAAKSALEAARAKVAEALGVRAGGIIFTSGGTEANALAILGYLTHLHGVGRSWETMEVVSTEIEHPSVVRTLTELSKRGVVVKMVPVDAEGFITPAALETVLSSHTVLVTFAYANSEVGVVQKVHTLARVLRAYEKKHAMTIALHVDAAQAPLWLPCDLPRLGADLLTLDGTKCGGPKGVGVLAMRKGVSVRSLMQGGGQESGYRPGTENVAGIVGMGEAVVMAQKHWQERAERAADIQLFARLIVADAFPYAIWNGPAGEGRIANNINFSIPGLDTEYATVVLDTAGIAVSTKSACSGAGGGTSTVVLAMTGDEARARSTLRFSLGEETTQAEVGEALDVLDQHALKMLKLT